jgi:hypothetical protein
MSRNSMQQRACLYEHRYSTKKHWRMFWRMVRRMFPQRTVHAPPSPRALLQNFLVEVWLACCQSQATVLVDWQGSCTVQAWPRLETAGIGAKTALQKLLKVPVWQLQKWQLHRVGKLTRSVSNYHWRSQRHHGGCCHTSCCATTCV